MIRNHQSVLSIRFSRTSILIFINSAMSQRNIWCLFAIPNTRYDSSCRFFYLYVHKMSIVKIGHIDSFDLFIVKGENINCNIKLKIPNLLPIM